MAQPPQPSLTPTEFSAAVTAITSAFGDPTRREIYLYIHERSAPGSEPESTAGATAGEVAEHFTLHPNVARHHLEKLAGGGYVEVATGRNGAGAGRPSKRYRVTAPDMSLELPVRHDDLLVTLLGKALSLLPHDQAEAMAEEVGVQYGKAMAASMGGTDRSADDVTGSAQKSFRASLHTVADALTAHGFAAHAERHGDGLRIVSENCPFGGAAIEHPVICAVDRGLVRGMLGALYGQAEAATSESRPMGDARCITAVASPSQAELARRA
jgi:predicted ArsR family transcriptional regulator